MEFKTLFNNIGGTVNTVTEFFEDQVIDPISNEVEYGVNEFRQGNSAPVLNTLSLGMSGAMAPLTQSVRGVDETEGTLLESAGNYVEDKTGIPSVVTQVAAGTLIPGPGEYKAAGKSIAKGARKALNSAVMRMDAEPVFAYGATKIRPKTYLSQDDFDIKQPQRIRDARDLVDESAIKIQNIEEANPGVTGKELQLTNKEYKAAKKVFKNKTAQVSSEESNVLAPGPGREYAYPPTRPRAKEMKVASLEVRKTIEDLELHHKLPKGISSAFFNRARDFMDKGLMTLDEFKDMAVRAQRRGMEPGDIEQNMLPQSKVPHNRFHTEMRAQPSNQFPGENLEISKTKLTQRLRQVKNKKELNKLWDEFLDDDGRYLYDTAEIWEPLDNAIKSVSPKYTGAAKSKNK